MRDIIVAAARGWIGTPYIHQASLRGVGADCLGLVRGVWREVAGSEAEMPPPYQPDWAEHGKVEALADGMRRHLIGIPATDYEAGDVLLFRWRAYLPAKHAGIATGPGFMVHAQEDVPVTEIALSDWWHRHLAFVFRFPGADA
jgi:NlpC/P60 family putative phage cell wall peptidase